MNEPIAWAVPRCGPSVIDPNGPPLIQSLRLLTAAPFAKMKESDHGLLGFPVLAEEPEEITFDRIGTATNICGPKPVTVPNPAWAKPATSSGNI